MVLFLKRPSERALGDENVGNAEHHLVSPSWRVRAMYILNPVDLGI